MVEAAVEPQKEPVKAPGGLESADVWGDEQDPLAELTDLSDAQIQEKIRDMEAEMRRNRNAMTRITQENRLYDTRVQEN